MKKIVFLILLVVMATTTISAQLNYATVNVTNATLLQASGRYLYYGDQVMTRKQCVDFLATRNKQAYEAFKSGHQCIQATWGLCGVGLGLDLVGSLLLAFAPEDENTPMSVSGDICIIAGCAAIIACLPTYFIGYSRLNKGIDTFNSAEAAAANQAYWTIQGSKDGIGLALHF